MQWGSGDPYGHIRREARSSSVNVSARSPEARKSKAEFALGLRGTLRHQTPEGGGAQWEPPCRHGWELAASTGTLSEQAGPNRGLEWDCNPDPGNPSD
ncbi:hypothetical protein NDU88_005816 [Pleurodeles waltl]|uniref:Uncharacterized protein n=1 Tax=Pleurodeles waltl TaxID=8319 RepID=A0AAV7NSL3_PLEWA|nr:hypothetical protein NDU88_005816 [Pleurodeles waltl]